MNTPNQQIPEFTQVKRVNKKQIMSAIFYGMLVVVVPVAGFVGAMKIDDRRNSDKPEVLGANVTSVKTNSDSNKLPIIGSLNFPSVLNASQLLIGFGALMGIVSIVMAASLMRNQPEPEQESSVPVQQAPVVEQTVVQ